MDTSVNSRPKSQCTSTRIVDWTTVMVPSTTAFEVTYAEMKDKTLGKVCVPPTDIPPAGRFAVLDDPQGGTFSIIKLAAQSES